ncbi:Mannose-6-phosphate isomerase 2 [Linum perenne]
MDSSDFVHNRRLRCSVLNYDWGIMGKDSLVGRLFALNSGSETQLNKPYAEFWMGIHGSAPSFVVDSGKMCNGDAIDSGAALSLKDWIVRNPSVLGDKVLDHWGSNLPFLFKELKDVLCNIPEIVELIDSKDVYQLLQINHRVEAEKVKSVLRSIFTQLMSASREMTTKAVSKLKIRLQMQSQVKQLTDKENLVLKLEKQYPDDIGVISAFFLNHLKLKPGQALYLGANEPHAYISGDCIEIMATSDNVVRAGLTPKYRDVPTLCSMLTYKLGFPEILKGFPLTPYITRYLPPFDEFEVDHCFLPKGASTVFPAVEGPSIFVITGGKGAMQAGSSSLKDVVTEGDVIFVPAGIQIIVTTASELHLYRAGVNSRFLQTL